VLLTAEVIEAFEEAVGETEARESSLFILLYAVGKSLSSLSLSNTFVFE
jgi:hypothetical protein